MRFNTKELAHYATTRFGKADKEGALWMKEYEGILKRKESKSVPPTYRECFRGTFREESVPIVSPSRSLHTEVVSTHRKFAILLQSRAPSECRLQL